MVNYDCVVVRLDGDYAHIRRLDKPEEEMKLVARALLPEQINEGTRLRYELLEYRIPAQEDE